MKGVLTGALTSASVVISLTAFAPLAYATNVTSVEISLDMPKAGEELSSQPEIVAVTPSEAQGSLSITNVVWKGADLESGAMSGTYDLTFDLEATGDFEFDALATYVVNDSAADVKVDYDNSRQATVTTPFKVIAKNSLTDLYKISYHQNFFDWNEKTVKRTPFTSIEVPSMDGDFTDWLAIAERNGYHFACWSTSPWSCDDPANPNKVTTTGAQYAAGEAIDLRSDVELYAQWTVGTFGIIFDANLPDATAPAFSAFPADGAKLSYSDAAAELEFAGFSREGYKLAGFSSDRHSTEPEYGLEDEIEVTDANVLLHAVWQVDDGTDDQTDADVEKTDAEDGETETDGEETDGNESGDEKAEGEEGDHKDVEDKDTATDGSSTDELLALDYDGDGVTDAYQKVETEAAASLLGASNARDLASQSEDTTYTVKYSANGGEGSMVEEEADPNSLYYVTGNEFTRDGYKFGGWSKSSRPTAEEDRLNPGDSIYVENNLTLYAQWDSDAYKVTFDANGGTNAPASRTYDSGSSYTLPKDKPTYDNFAFGGWLDSVSNSVYQPGDEYGTLDSDVTFTAVWGDSYKITFDANGGSGSMDALVVPKGETTTLPQNKFKNSKAEFLGWSESASSTTPTYQDRQMNVQFSYDTTLYAVWSESSGSSSSSSSSSSSKSSSDSDSDSGSSSSSRSGTVYAISYRPNSGSGSMDKQSVPSGESIVLEGSDFTREGYTFTGWNTSASGSGTAYVPGDTVTPTSNMSLYAQWVPTDGEEAASASSSDSRSRSALEADDSTIASSPSSSASSASSSSSASREAPPTTADPQSTAPVILAGISGILTVIGAKLLRRKND